VRVVLLQLDATVMATRHAKDPWTSRDHPIREHMDFQRKSWIATRIGWGAIALVILSAALGLFAGGPLSRATAESGDRALIVAYERFARHDALSDIRVTAAPDGGEMVTIAIDRAIADHFTIEHMMPEAVQTAGGLERLELTYSAPGGAPVAILLSMRANGIGNVCGRISSGSSTIEFHQFIYP
jgi:hypothetical protein